MIYRIYVEKKDAFKGSLDKLSEEIKALLNINLQGIRRFLRYDVEGIEKTDFIKAKGSIFSEPPVDNVYDNIDDILDNNKYIILEYLPGQYDQRADSAAQCVQLLTMKKRPNIRCASIYVFSDVTSRELDLIRNFLINPVETREGSRQLPNTLKSENSYTFKSDIINGFIDNDSEQLKEFYNDFGFAMNYEDLCFIQDYFIKTKRNPTLTELKVIDTYWSDHCRHTTFLTELSDIKVNSNVSAIADTLKQYDELFKEINNNRDDKYKCLMDIATIAVKKLKKEGYLDNLDVSDEINACSVVVKVDIDGEYQDYLIMFKNETHNHPTEIEPFGGAATCLGGAIRDPLSGRVYVYQAMRITGSADPRESLEDTLEGKLPQRIITTTATSGFSSYGNQIGLATGMVKEIYHSGYKAKRLETGYVIGGAPYANVRREKPQSGDIVILLGGDTGRDGCGGATGSSKSHTIKSVDECGAEVQKGNAPEERKIQRFFRNSEVSKMIIKCNDFGAGGVCVAIGELADGLDIYLDKVTKKYDGLTPTELAISESQERMAVVIKPHNKDLFISLALEENIKATEVAQVTDNNTLRMFYESNIVVDIKRDFLDTNGVKQLKKVEIVDNYCDYFNKLDNYTQELVDSKEYFKAIEYNLSSLNVCSQKGMGENFDSTIGASTVLMPFGGKNQLTPSFAMAAKPPVYSGYTSTVTVSSYAYYPHLMSQCQFIGAIYSVIGSLSKLVASGVKYDSIRLTFQEYFKKLGASPTRWGEPVSALLGALNAQLALKVAAIGGKDSMSGTFENIDVPPTLISFAMGISNEKNIRHNAISLNKSVYLCHINRDNSGMPDYGQLAIIYEFIEKGIDNGDIINTMVVEDGGAICALLTACFGNDKGATIIDIDKELFKPYYGDILFVASDNLKHNQDFISKIAIIDDSNILKINNQQISCDILKNAFINPLETIFPSVKNVEENDLEISNYMSSITFKSSIKVAKPRVFIPVFPGTNCEYDTANAFIRNGGIADVFVIKNQTSEDIEQSIKEMVKRINNSQIIAFPGGFSGGDEPDGSGKFIATTFKNPLLKDAVLNMLLKNDGLALGICNGFQALIKLGLLPYGEINDQIETSPTLTNNNIARHVSTISRIRISSNNSPWLNSFNIGDVFSVPVSHGEGKFIASKEHIDIMLKNGQIATQYVDMDNKITSVSPYNPNGSTSAIEGIISTDGRILGKMGHSERYNRNLYLNVQGNYDMNIFKNGILYFS